MKQMIFAWLVAVALAVASVGSAAAHQINIDPLGQGSGTSVIAGGGPAHCNAQAPEKATESSPVVSFEPPHAVENC